MYIRKKYNYGLQLESNLISLKGYIEDENSRPKILYPKSISQS